MSGVFKKFGLKIPESWRTIREERLKKDKNSTLETLKKRKIDIEQKILELEKEI